VINQSPIIDTYLDGNNVRWVPYYKLFHGLFEKLLAHSVSGVQLISGLKLPVNVEHHEGALWHEGGNGYDGYHGSIPLLLRTMSMLNVSKSK